MHQTDHSSVYAFLKALEAKGIPGGFSGYGGAGLSGMVGNALVPYLRQMVPGAKYDYETEAGELWRNSALAACFGWLERNFPEPRLKVERRVKGHVYEEVEDHPGAALLDRPNKHYDSDILWAGTLISYVVDGNAYWVKGRTDDGRTLEYYYVPHWQMEPRWPGSGKRFISHYEYMVDGRRYPLKAHQVIHYRNGLDPNNTRKGWSKTKTAVREVCTDNQAAGYAATLCRNMGIPGVAIMPESDEDTFEKDQRAEIKDQWREETTDEARGGALVSSARIKIQEITLSPEKMVLDKIRTIPEARMLATVGLNSQVLNLTSGENSKTFANYEQSRQAAYEDCLCPMQRRLARQYTLQSPEVFAEGERLAWDYSAVPAMQGDMNNKGKRAVVLFQGGLATKDEARGMVHLAPVGGEEGGAFHQGEAMRGAQPMLSDNRMGEGDE